MDGYSTTPGTVADTILRVLGDRPTSSAGGYPSEANSLQRRVVRLGAIRPSLMGGNLNHLKIIALTIFSHTTVSFRGQSMQCARHGIASFGRKRCRAASATAAESRTKIASGAKSNPGFKLTRRDSPPIWRTQLRRRHQIDISVGRSSVLAHCLLPVVHICNGKPIER